MKKIFGSPRRVGELRYLIRPSVAATFCDVCGGLADAGEYVLTQVRAVETSSGIRWRLVVFRGHGRCLRSIAEGVPIDPTDLVRTAIAEKIGIE